MRKHNMRIFNFKESTVYSYVKTIKLRFKIVYIRSNPPLDRTKKAVLDSLSCFADNSALFLFLFIGIQ